jgi:hypothetical protein
MFTLRISTSLLCVSFPPFLLFPLPLPLVVLLLLLRDDLLLARLVLAPGAHRLFVKEVAHRDGKLTCLFLVCGPHPTAFMCAERPVHRLGLAAFHPKVARDSIHDVEHCESVWAAVLFLTAVLAHHRCGKLDSHAIDHQIPHVLTSFVLRARAWGAP